MFDHRQMIYERFVRWNNKNCKEVKTWERGVVINGIYFIGGMISLSKNEITFRDLFVPPLAQNSVYVENISREMNCDYTKYI